jgi:flagellar FliL protein
VPGPVAPLDPFVVNLRDEGSSRYLKTSFEIEVDKPETLAEVEAQKRALRDSVLRYLSNLTVADTLGEEAKQKITDGIMARLEKELGEGKVKKLYFTDFVIQ